LEGFATGYLAGYGLESFSLLLSMTGAFYDFSFKEVFYYTLF